MYVEEIKSKQRNKIYRAYLIRQSYKDRGKVKHRTLANISHLPIHVIMQIKAILAGKGAFIDCKELETSFSREYGASAAFLEFGRKLGLDKLIYSRKEQWREDLMAMVVGRIVYQGSKLHLSNLYMDSVLWELCGHSPGKKVNVHKHCYFSMDKLLERQNSIQKQLAKKHLIDGCLVLYDITNTWFEGEYSQSEIVDYGHCKEGKKGYKQIAIGLITDKRGCPIAVKVFGGQTSDQMTVKEQVEKLAKEFGVKEIVFAGDRGMLTPKRIDEVGEHDFKTLTALTHPQIRELLAKKLIQPELFDEKNLVEVIDPDNPEVRYILCKNNYTMEKERESRNSLIEKVNSNLTKISSVKRRRNKSKVCAQIGALFERYKVEKFYDWSVDDEGRVHWVLNHELVERESLLDGCYIIRTDVSTDKMSKEEAVNGYKSLSGVEKAFRNMKTVSLEMRPVYHKIDDRIRSHVFLCMLAYYIQWHAMELLAPLLKTRGKQSQRRWSFPIIIERLKSIRKENIKIKGINIIAKVSKPSPEQQKIMDLLGVKI